jgi:hypothetical protein
MATAMPLEDEDWPRTVAAFEAWHALQEERWEFVEGRPRLMAPASMPHTVIKNNVGFALRQALAARAAPRWPTARRSGPRTSQRSPTSW